MLSSQSQTCLSLLTMKVPGKREKALSHSPESCAYPTQRSRNHMRGAAQVMQSLVLGPVQAVHAGEQLALAHL